MVFNKYKLLSTFTMGTGVVLILYTSVLWKKKGLKVPRSRRNLLTMKQTVAIRVWLTFDLYLVQLILMIIPKEKILMFEMIKLIIVDNLCYKFLIPLALIFTSRKKLPQLWSERSEKRKRFYMTEQERKLPRRATNHTKNPRKELTKSFINNEERRFIYVKTPQLE